MIIISSIIEKRWFRKTLFLLFNRKNTDLGLVIPNNLSRKDRLEFIWRAKYFLNTTEIEFREFEQYDAKTFQRVRDLLGSVAAQMTFRLPDKCFGIYSKIIIYPDYFYSRVGKNYHKGETNPGAGVIVFSLRGITEGFDLPFDGENLIFHEFAHALYLEHKGMTYNLFDEKIFDAVERFADDTIHDDSIPGHFLRDYALTNKAEFFAVAIENFFERPDDFRKAMPDLFTLLLKLFRYDPALLKYGKAVY
jgi:Mlc titration factor MtfA (ptsG expression regulator)